MDSTREQNKTDRSDKLDTAIIEMGSILDDLSDMFQRIKKVKFEYLMKTCDIYTKVDLPSLMMDSCEKDFKELVPTPERIRKMNF